MIRAFVIVLLAAVVGCTPYQPPAQIGQLQPENPEYVMVIVIDMSGSFKQAMNGGKAWQAVNKMIQMFFRDRQGENDRIVIANISSTPQGPIWSGSPKSFKAQFRGPDAFRGLLQKNQGYSRVYDSIAEAADYALPMMGKGQAGCFVFSDMVDNLSDPKGEERMLKSLSEFSKAGGSVGLYWCEFHEAGNWRKKLQGVVKNFVVTSDIDADVQLPSWD